MLRLLVVSSLKHPQILLYPETNMQNIRDQIDEIKPDFLVIDSIQTMNEPSLDSMVGSASQVREVTSELMKIAKNEQITTSFKCQF